jgi:hypothetical protein
MINSIFGLSGVTCSTPYTGTYLKLGNGIISPEKMCLTVHASGINNTGTFDIYVSNDIENTVPYGHKHTSVSLGTPTYTGKWETDYPYKQIKFQWTPGSVTAGQLYAHLSGIKKEI